MTSTGSWRTKFQPVARALPLATRWRLQGRGVGGFCRRLDGHVHGLCGRLHVAHAHVGEKLFGALFQRVHHALVRGRLPSPRVLNDARVVFRPADICFFIFVCNKMYLCVYCNYQYFRKYYSTQYCCPRPWNRTFWYILKGRSAKAYLCSAMRLSDSALSMEMAPCRLAICRLVFASVICRGPSFRATWRPRRALPAARTRQYLACVSSIRYCFGFGAEIDVYTISILRCEPSTVPYIAAHFPCQGSKMAPGQGSPGAGFTKPLRLTKARRSD